MPCPMYRHTGYNILHCNVCDGPRTVGRQRKLVLYYNPLGWRRPLLAFNVFRELGKN